MNRWYAFWQLFLARLREFYREPEVLFWVYGFPILLAVGLGVAFANREPEPPTVDVLAGADRTEAEALLHELQGHRVQAELHDEDACRQRLRVGKTYLYVVPRADGYEYVYDATRVESVSARYEVDALVQRWKAGERAWRTDDVLLTEPGTRYIDFLLPGLLGLNLMGGGLWGVGFVLVDLRVRKLLKRLLATPMRRGDFLLSILSGRLIFTIPEMILLVAVGRLGFGVPVRGSYLLLTLTLLVGAAAFAGIGLLVACRAEKTETVSGLMNAVMLPMWLLSGTFFSAKRFPDVAQPLVQALPLTQLNNALRDIMLEGAGFADVAWRLGILAAYGVVTFYLGLRWFRWQ
jgi:ABC-type multidrug transport system permease subunit